MSIAVVARKLLWGRAGNRCAWETCTQRLTEDLHDPESKALAVSGAVIGEEAHIRSGRPDGPRFDAGFPAEEIDGYGNLILLCPTHHTHIDKDGGAAWSIEAVLDMKRKHELRIDALLPDLQRRRRSIEERLVASVAVWESKVAMEEWQQLTYGLNQPIPAISDQRMDRLRDLGEWLLAKTWPADFPAVASAFERHSSSVRAMIQHLSFSMEPKGQAWQLRREYKDIQWNPTDYERLLKEFYLESAVLWYLVIDLTKSCNAIISAVQEELDPLYRFDDGVVLSRDGDGFMSNRLVRLEFEGGEVLPFPGLAQIRSVIASTAESLGVTPDEVDLYSLHVV